MVYAAPHGVPPCPIRRPGRYSGCPFLYGIEVREMLLFLKILQKLSTFRMIFADFELNHEFNSA